MGEDMQDVHGCLRAYDQLDALRHGCVTLT